MSFCILAVEDDPNILISIEFLLTNAGYDVLTAADGTQAWDALQAHHPDLVVLDIMLPEIDGFELCRRIRAAATLKATKVMILSARGRDVEIEKGTQLGADAYLRKPFGTHEFLDIVSRLLKS